MHLLRLATLVILAIAISTPRASAKAVSLETEDGHRLAARLEVAPGATRGVALIHGDGRSGEDWRFLANRLQQLGLSVIIPDLRGHGASASAGMPSADAEFQAMVHDVQAAMESLRNAGVTTLFLVGADLGANLALEAASRADDVKSVVMLTPAMQYRGVRADLALKAYGARPLLMVVSGDDKYATKSALVLETQARGSKHLEIYENAGKGATMLNREPALQGLITSWLTGSHKLVDNPEGIRPEVDPTRNQEAIETTGPKLPGH